MNLLTLFLLGIPLKKLKLDIYQDLYIFLTAKKHEEKAKCHKEKSL